jgi:hypothetical protein
MLEKEKFEQELNKIQQEIYDIKLKDWLDIKKLKELINKRENIKFKLSIWK